MTRTRIYFYRVKGKESLSDWHTNRHNAWRQATIRTGKNRVLLEKYNVLEEQYLDLPFPDLCPSTKSTVAV